MPKTTILDNTFITMSYDSDAKIVSHKIHQYTSGQPLRDALLAGVDQLKKNSAHKWISDDRNSGALPKDDQEWINTIWTKKAIGAGWKFWALVMPASVVGLQNMRRLSDGIAQIGVTLKVFSDPVQALAWLKAAK
jgi:hypothetical protein